MMVKSMRSSIQLVVLLSAITVGHSATAAPITGGDLQAQSKGYNLDSNQYPGHISDDPILVSRQDFDPKPIASSMASSMTRSGATSNHGYFPVGSAAVNILANDIAPLPEPPTLLLLGSGILAMAIVWRHRRIKT